MDNLRIPRDDFAFYAHEDTRRGMFARMHLNLPADLIDNYVLPMSYTPQDEYVLATRPEEGRRTSFPRDAVYYHRKMNERERQFRQSKQHLEDTFPEFVQRYAPEPIRDQAPQFPFYPHRANQTGEHVRGFDFTSNQIHVLYQNHYFSSNENNQYRLPSGQVIERYVESLNPTTRRYDYFQPDEEKFDYYISIFDDEDQGQIPFDTSIQRYNLRDEPI